MRVKSWLIVIATLALANCSAINIVYNNASSFIAAEIDDAFDLSDTQEEQVDAALQRFFEWHRQRELPRYREMLDDAALAIADGISAQEYLVIYDAVRDAFQRSLLRLIDELHGLAATLTPAQIDHYDQYFRERSEKHRDYLEMSAQQREIYNEEWVIDKMEDWFGNFDELQRERIATRLHQLPEVRLAWLKVREARHQAFLAALRKAVDSGLPRQQLQHILLDPGSEYARVYEPQRIAYRQAFAEMIEEVSDWLSKAQIRHAVERLHEYEEVVIELQLND